MISLHLRIYNRFKLRYNRRYADVCLPKLQKPSSISQGQKKSFVFLLSKVVSSALGRNGSKKSRYIRSNSTSNSFRVHEYNSRWQLCCRTQSSNGKYTRSKIRKIRISPPQKRHKTRQSSRKLRALDGKYTLWPASSRPYLPSLQPTLFIDLQERQAAFRDKMLAQSIVQVDIGI